MRRLLLCLPLCLLLVPWGADGGATSFMADDQRPFVDDETGLPDNAGLEKLARTDPLAFLENCLRRYHREVQGYTCTMLKQERLAGKLQPPELIAVSFREKPFSVLLRWIEGARLANAALYVEGENQESVKGTSRAMMLVHPAGLAGRLVKVVSRDPEGEEARQSGRYTLPQFGIELGTLRTLNTWKAAKARGQLNVEFLGEEKVKEAGDRLCYKLRRPRYDKPEEDGVTELTIFVDKETWLQVGSELKGEKGYIARYFFRDIKLNPKFKDDTFSKDGLTQ